MSTHIRKVELLKEYTKNGAAICFSHLRWDFVFQRPQHIIGRLCKDLPVIFMEEPIFSGVAEPWLQLDPKSDGLTVARLRVPAAFPQEDVVELQKVFLDSFLADSQIVPKILWYYSPMALQFSDHLKAEIVIYDCMDELSAFQGAHPALRTLENNLMSRADLVFTGGRSLYESKRIRHSAVHLFPSSVDVAHFAPARIGLEQPEDQRSIPSPRLGFFGVIDERLDQELLAAVADARPDWNIVMIGPVAKIDPAALPSRPNIHYLGPKSYDQLPTYLSGWDVALMPFAINEATRFISPTKTPEYLAAGRPVVSTQITDVIRQYGKLSGVEIAGTAVEFVSGVERALDYAVRPLDWWPEVDRLLSAMSWDKTWSAMSRLIAEKRRSKLDHLVAPVAPARPAPARKPDFDYLIVGAGFAGSVLAERLATDAGQRVLLIDKRDHVGGNAFDHLDANGVLVHRYGPHIFHTNADRIVEYLSRFTGWRPYEHRVLAQVGGQLLPVPINRTTVNGFFGLDLSEAEVERFLAEKAVSIGNITNSEQVVLSRVGHELYEALFRGYTQKQWGVDPRELDSSVAGRIPVRSGDDDRYFGDSFQQMPIDGYTRMFERMLDHADITVSLGTDYRDIRTKVEYRHLIYTGPIDEFFDYRYGRLPYRSLRFEHQTFDQEQFQPVGVVNYPSRDTPYTRITEYKHLTGQASPYTSISYEYPSAEGDPYYPVPQPENTALFARYRALADATPNASFVGRLATYRYYNMDQVAAQALTLYDRLRARHLAEADDAKSPDSITSVSKMPLEVSD